jgi:hypothetical protein
MPIRPYLFGQHFDPQTIGAMSDTFTCVCTALGLIERDDPATRLVAERVIGHAMQGVKSRAKPFALVIAEFRQKASRNTRRQDGARLRPSPH